MKEYIKTSVTIAEILHLAADKFLASKESELWNNGGYKEKFSCCAVTKAVCELYNKVRIMSEGERDELINRCSEGLKAMGCPTDSMYAFNDRDNFVEENQQARYTWLKFAAIIAEEQENCLAKLVKQGV